jgi:hypothetical protein
VAPDPAIVPDTPFEAPWQARAFALAVATVEGLGLPWDAFRDRLKVAIAADPERPYYESWVVALDALTADRLFTGPESGPVSVPVE